MQLYIGKSGQSGGSPLLYNSFLQAGKLRKIFKKNKEPNFVIDVAMRYGKPSIESKLVEYDSKGYKKILILPMFPQYSTTTAKSIANKLELILKKNIGLRKNLNISFIKDFHDHEMYIKAAANHIRKFKKNMVYLKNYFYHFMVYLNLM